MPNNLCMPICFLPRLTVPRDLWGAAHKMPLRTWIPSSPRQKVRQNDEPAKLPDHPGAACGRDAPAARLISCSCQCSRCQKVPRRVCTPSGTSGTESHAISSRGRTESSFPISFRTVCQAVQSCFYGRRQHRLSGCRP